MSEQIVLLRGRASNVAFVASHHVSPVIMALDLKMK